MKKHVSGFLFFFCLTAACLLTLFFMTRPVETEDVKKVQATESVEEPGFAQGAGKNDQPDSVSALSEAKTEEGMDLHLVLNQEQVEAEKTREQYCLVAENGYLLVYNHNRVTVSLLTHMPVEEFPESEQERLMEGIWFPTMTAIFSYLESYSS